MTKTVTGIEYSLPRVILAGTMGIGNAEIGARSCYDSFHKSESKCIAEIGKILSENDYDEDELFNLLDEAKNLEDSDLLKQLSFVAFHNSVLEHNVMTFIIKGTSRGVLQELVRHRIASYSVRSTRYTLDELMYTFIVAKYVYNDVDAKQYFINKVLELDLLVTTNENYNRIEIAGMWDKLNYQSDLVGKDEMLSLILPASSIEDFNKCTNMDDAFDVAHRMKKRNVGDSFKHLITDNVKVDLLMTINLSSLKNFFKLRLSGAAWFQIQWLAQAMKDVVPEASKKLIFKKES